MTEKLGQPVHELGALQEGDRVLLDDRSKPLTVIESRIQTARLRGPDGGEHVVTDWKSVDPERGEFRLAHGGSVRIRCLSRADGTLPDGPIGQRVERDQTPTGGLSTAFTTANER